MSDSVWVAMGRVVEAARFHLRLSDMYAKEKNRAAQKMIAQECRVSQESLREALAAYDAAKSAGVN